MKLNRTRETVRCRHPGWTVLQIIKAVRFQIVGGAAEPLQRGHRFFLRVDIGLPSDKAPDDPSTIVVPSLIKAYFYDMSGKFAAIMARSEEHTSELQSLMRISYAVFC